MDKSLVTILLLASVIGPMTCSDVRVAPPEPPHKVSTTLNPDTTTVAPPITSTLAPNTTTTTTTTTSAPPTNHTTPITTTHPTTISPKPTTTTKPTPPTNGTTTTPPSPHPPTTPVPPSDRKFEPFSFIGGFALCLGLVAIGFLSWKLYISRRENVYHTL